VDRPEPRPEGGFSLVILVVAVTVLSIMTAAALPLWSNAIQREKEEELISRGLQYVEAIRVFNLRYGHPPVRLEELLETKPRCIRRLWKDPMVENGKWGIIFQNQNPNLQPQQIGDGQLPPDPNCPNCPRPTNPNPGKGGAPGGDDNDPNAPPKKGDTVAVGPITGVYSKSHKKSILIFNGRERYDEWHFTLELVNLSGPPRVEAQGAAVPLPPVEGGTPLRSLRWIGRPFPPFLGQMQNGTLPNGQPPANTKPGFNVPRPDRQAPKG
jgi:type II secretory pathway pseudopilin PulG